MKRFRKVYLEISNVCNLRCRFCPGTKRTPKVMVPEEFARLMPKLRKPQKKFPDHMAPPANA